MEGTPTRESRASSICAALGRLHSAVDRLQALKHELQQGGQDKIGEEVATAAPTPPLAELLEKLHLELGEISNRVEGLTSDMRDMLI